MKKIVNRLKFAIPILASLVLACVTSSGSGSGSALGVAGNQAVSVRSFGNFPTPFEARVPFAPMPFGAEGQIHLAYELYITNFSTYTRDITRVDVLGDLGDAPLITYQGADLARYIGQPGTPAHAPIDTRTMGPGTIAIAYIWVVVNDMASVPNTIRHKLYFKAANPADPDEELLTQWVTVNKNPVPVIGPPLKAGRWLAGNGPTNDPMETHHRRSVLVLHGKAVMAQRFGVDYQKINDAGSGCSAPCANNTDFYSYGEDLIAVTDGVITATMDGIPDNPATATVPVVPMNEFTAGGNYAVLDIGGGYYAFYAHMIPGSLKVKVGDHVTRGQVLGSLGNSGNSQGAHLHFHVCNAPSFVNSEGVPYVHEAFTLHGHWREWYNEPAGAVWTPGPGDVDQIRNMELPLADAVFTFQ